MLPAMTCVSNMFIPRCYIIKLCMWILSLKEDEAELSQQIRLLSWKRRELEVSGCIMCCDVLAVNALHVVRVCVFVFNRRYTAAYWKRSKSKNKVSFS